MTVGVFISYNHDDIRIANALKQCLSALSNGIRVFIDHAGLVSGDEYEPTLARNIAASQWFLMVCSGPPRPERDMGWCLMEAGQFRTKLLNEHHEKLIRSRLVAIHDDDRPRPVAQYESIRMRPLNNVGLKLDLKPGSEDLTPFEATDAYKLFSNIVQHSTDSPLRNLADPDDRNLVLEQARRLIRVYAEANIEFPLPEVVLQPRISFQIPAITGTGGCTLSDETRITGYDASLRDIFSLLGSETTWGDIKRRVRERDGADAMWVSDVEAAATQVTRDLVPEQPEGLCMSVRDRKEDVKFYRVLFTRYIPYRGGARTCFLLFIPSRPRQFDMKRRSSILLSSLILSIRFRQKVLPFMDELRDAGRAKLVDRLMDLERTLHQVETEAMEFGLKLQSEEDELPLLQVISGGNRDFVQRAVSDWAAGRKALGAAFLEIRQSDSEASRTQAASTAQRVAVEELEKVQAVNGAFIKAVSEELLAMEQLGRED